METTSILADFIIRTSYRDIPPETVKFARELILHCLGGALGGAQEPSSRTVINFVKKIGGVPEASVMGAGFRSSAVNAAFVGGVAPHAIEVEDGSWPGGSSPITVVPVVFALGETMHVSGKDIIEAFVAGFEVQARLAAAIAASALSRGASTLATMGTLGAAAAAAKMLRLDVEQVTCALGLAAAQAAGLSETSAGFAAHYLQSGASCRNGLTAAMLAKEGLDANPRSLEMKNGLLDVLCIEGRYDPAKITDGIGSPFLIEQVRVKKYPSCTLNHRIIDGILALVEEHRILPEQIDSIEIGVNSVLPRVLAYPEPENGEQAKFSLPYNVATAVLERKLDLEDFTEHKVHDPARREFMKKVKAIVHPGWESAGTMTATNPVTIELKDGRQHSRDCVYATGGPEARLSTEEICALFRPMARRVLVERDVRRVEELVLNLEKVNDLNELTGLLLGPTSTVMQAT